MSQFLDMSTKKQRLVGLDLFRIMAMLMIFLFHTGIVGCEYGILQLFVRMGPIFMTGFFMLSGFSLYYSYESTELTRIAAIKEFYKKRAASILPLYWFLSVLYMIFLGSESLLQNVTLLPVEILGIQSAYSSLYLYSHNGGTWFVTCILFCYLVFPFMSECVKQLSVRTRIILLVLAGVVLLYSPFVIHMFEQQSIYTNPLFRMLEFFIGIILASFAKESYGSKFLKGLLVKKVVLCLEFAVLVAAVTLAMRLGIGVGDYMLYSWICLPIFSLLLLGLAQAEFPVLKKSKVVRYFSDISYTMYLAQFFTWSATSKIVLITGNNSSLFKCIVSLFVCVCISVLMHEFVEKPCKKIWLRRSHKI